MFRGRRKPLLIIILEVPLRSSAPPSHPVVSVADDGRGTEPRYKSIFKSTH